MDLAATRARVDDAVSEALGALRGGLEPVGIAGEDLLEPLAALASRGKRMRAALLFAAHHASGGTSPHAAVRVAAALELFQTAALVHDDVLDRSDTRRGMPSVHRAIEGRHRTSGLDGDAERYGVNGAILAGDLCLMACLGEVAAACAELPPGVGVAVAERFRAMSTLCTAGQYLDIRLAASPVAHAESQRAEIVAVMRSKTASYTTEGPLALGAAIAGLSSADVDAWAAAGVPLGIAFQLRDDLLGVVGDADVTGKPAGDDLREGKKTVLLAEALGRASAEGKRAILAVAGVPDATDADVSRAIDAIIASGAVSSVEAEISGYGAQARKAFASLATSKEAGAALNALVDDVLERVA